MSAPFSSTPSAAIGTAARASCGKIAFMTQELTAAGLGLHYGSLRLERTPESWLEAGRDLREQVAELLSGSAAAVEAIGSSSVIGLLAKPIIDLAVGLSRDSDPARVRAILEDSGWIFRGDAGDDGGLVFVLEARPWVRVAHLHGVVYGGSQWNDYLRFRDLLRVSEEARERYEVEKLRLIALHGQDHRGYTSGKTPIVRRLLGNLNKKPRRQRRCW